MHHDANDYNVLVDEHTTTGTPSSNVSDLNVSDRNVSGLIDFGDMVFARQVNELAVTLAYGLLDVDDVVAAGRDIISGYVSEFPLTAEGLKRST